MRRRSSSGSSTREQHLQMACRKHSGERHTFALSNSPSSTTAWQEEAGAGDMTASHAHAPSFVCGKAFAWLTVSVGVLESLQLHALKQHHCLSWDWPNNYSPAATCPCMHALMSS